MKKRTFSHVDAAGKPTMVDVSPKAATARMARAQAIVRLGTTITSEIRNQELQTKKGPVFHTAIIAGVMAAKKTADLIPLCHPLGLDDCQVDIQPEDDRVVVTATTRVVGKTGVEMEALTAVSVAALTIYDMCKALSHDIAIEDIRLMEKSGGKKDFKRKSG